MLDKINKELAKLKVNNMYRELPSVTRCEGSDILLHSGQRLISFSCNDYLGLIGHPLLKESAVNAINNYGVGAGASRMVTGNNILYESLESKLAELYGTEKALVFSSGYLANVGVISTLASRDDMIVSDKLVHSSSIDGIRLSQAKNYRFEHNNYRHCEYILREYRSLHKHCFIVVEQVYSMDGDIAPIDRLKELAEKYNSFLITDCAHSFGLMPCTNSDVYIGTLSKAVGVLGGYVCASEHIIKYIQNKAKTFIYTTALPPMILATASTALDIIRKGIENVPLQLAKFFCKNLNLSEPYSHIVPLVMKDIDTVLHAQQVLQGEGFLVIAIRPPTSPTPRLRFVFGMNHKFSDVKKLCEILKQMKLA
ncbi:MAG: aminotransferase class I/II-fold pyridoxal phosphate-dependent enzyme [Ehrlichia sp.]